MTPPSGRPGQRAWGWILALVLSVAFVGVESASRIRHLKGLEAAYGGTVAAPVPDAASPSGYELGVRSFIPPDTAPDSFQVVMQTQAMLAGGPLRIHRVAYDNAPFGREMHWSSLNRWWLALLARACGMVTGSNAGESVEQAAFFANPLLLCLFLCGFIPALGRRFGWAPAALVAAGFISCFPIYVRFTAGNVEHQGAVLICAFVSAVGLIGGAGGWVLSGPAATASFALPTRRQARAWFVASALAGGVGLWVSAASEAPLLAGLGLGGIASVALARRDQEGEGASFDAGLWRLWGVTGCSVSLLAYLAEYFPSSMGMRLEVNHPLYALAWLGGAEIVCILGGERRSPGEGARRGWGRPARLAGAALLLGALPATLILIRERTFWVADPFLWRLHNDYIAEFQGLVRHLNESGWRLWSPYSAPTVIPFLLCLPPLAYALRPGIPRIWRCQFALAVVPAAVEILLSLEQLRWGGLALCTSLVAAVPFLCFLSTDRPGRVSSLAWRLACLLTLVPGLAMAGRMATGDGQFSDIYSQWLADRDLGQWLRHRAGRDPVTVLSSPSTTNTLVYFGDLRGLGTLYWEDRDGLKAAAEIFSASSLDKAHELVRKRGITHLVLTTWGMFDAGYVALARGLPPGSQVPSDTLVSAILRRETPPAWLRLIPYPTLKGDGLQGGHVLIFEVTDPQTPLEVAMNSASYQLEMGNLLAAAHLVPALRSDPSSIAALAVLARIEFLLGDREGFTATLRRIASLKPFPANLPAEGQLRLAVALELGGRFEDSREVMERCLAALDERSLRHLSPGALGDMLTIAKLRGVTLQDPKLRGLALSLQPPGPR